MWSFFSLSIFFFFLRVCLSGSAHGVHANRKVLAVALFQRHSKHTGKRKDQRGDVDEGRKWSLGWKDHPLSHFFIIYLPSFPFSIFLFYTLSNSCVFFPPTSFFSIQSGSQSTSSETKKWFPQSSFGGLFVPSNNFLWHSPNRTIIRSIRDFMFLGFLLSFWIY